MHLKAVDNGPERKAQSRRRPGIVGEEDEGEFLTACSKISIARGKLESNILTREFLTQTRKQWRVPRGTQNGGPPQPRVIAPGDSGIFATCNKGRESKCVGELRDLFSEYAELLYGEGENDEDEDKGAGSIENDIQAELAGIQKPPKAQLFVPVKLEVQCGEFLPYLVFMMLSLSQSRKEARRKRASAARIRERRNVES